MDTADKDNLDFLSSSEMRMVLVNKQKTLKKGADDETAISNGESTVFAVLGYRVVFPFLAVYTKKSPKNSLINSEESIKRPDGFRKPELYGEQETLIALRGVPLFVTLSQMHTLLGARA